MDLYQKSQVRKIKNEHDFRFTKSLGQNFLVSREVICEIIEASQIGESDLVIEIGPGMGTLTGLAAQRARKLIAVEIDSDLIPILKETLAEYGKVAVISGKDAAANGKDVAINGKDDAVNDYLQERSGSAPDAGAGATDDAAEADIVIVNDDILKTDLAAMIQAAKAADPGIEGVRIIGNLPYYITTPIIMKILREDLPAEKVPAGAAVAGEADAGEADVVASDAGEADIRPGGNSALADSITIMMQKEVADRIKAAPGSKTYGALSVAVQYYCEVSEVCEAPAECFEPRPKVDSEVLRLDIRGQRAVSVKDEDLFFDCVKAGFSQRRKTLANCMKNLSRESLSKEEIAAVLADAGIEPVRRAETLSIEEFGALADSVYRLKKNQ
jgi:16S rRNA (adenine1518-N6/adenine1519-N6)-dimethyltransferase